MSPAAKAGERLHALPALREGFRSPLRNLGGNHNVRQVARRVCHLHVLDSPYCPKVLAIWVPLMYRLVMHAPYNPPFTSLVHFMSY